MTDPTPVQIVRPTKSKRSRIAEFVAAVAAQYFTAGWLIMLVLPAVTSLHFGYWRVVGALFILRWITFGTDPKLDMWSTSFVEWRRSK